MHDARDDEAWQKFQVWWGQQGYMGEPDINAFQQSWTAPPGPDDTYSIPKPRVNAFGEPGYLGAEDPTAGVSGGPYPWDSSTGQGPVNNMGGSFDPSLLNHPQMPLFLGQFAQAYVQHLQAHGAFTLPPREPSGPVPSVDPGKLEPTVTTAGPADIAAEGGKQVAGA